MKLPQRTSLIGQVVEILRGEIASGHWQTRLPGERALADHLQVSRSTLRGALEQLHRRGLIETRRKRHWLRAPSSKGRRPVAKSRVIGWLYGEAHEDLLPYKVRHIDEVRRHLHDAGYALEVHCAPHLHHQHTHKNLHPMVRLSEANVWILTQTPLSVQQWFLEAGSPTLIAGSRHPGISLPAIDFDYRSISRHAAGLFASHGHRRVGFLTPALQQLIGDRISLQGFQEGMAAATSPHPEVVLAEHDKSLPRICSAVEFLVCGKNPVTGIFVSHPNHLLAVISHLGRLRLRVPQEVSLISRQHDTPLDFLVPSIACYEFNHHHYAMRVSQMAVRMIEEGSVRSRQITLMVHFIAGDSLGRVKRSA